MIGRTIGHYKVLDKLGEGGMGVVYRARDTRLDRFVALKLLPADRVRDAERRLRFVQEAKAASALNHPHIITIHDIDAEGDPPFIVMEYVEGKVLDEIIPRKGLRLGEALKYATQIADALARAHAAGIIHRDLKPSNVMVDSHGLAKVLDFGLAKLSEAEAAGEDERTRTAAATEPGIVVGTAAYMSPEQAEGRKVDPRSDIFSFGAVLYEMIMGRRAFDGGSTLATLSAVLHQEPKPVEEIPHDLERIISRCLRKDPARRFQTMADLKVALEELREESDSGRLATVQRERQKPRRAVRVAAAVILVALVSAGIWYGRHGTPSNPEPAVPVPLTSYAGNVTDPAFSPDGNQVAFAWNGEKQDNFDIYIKLVGPGAPLRLTTNPAPERSPAWSPDGRQIAFLRFLSASHTAVMSIPALGGPERKLAEGMFGPWISWSRNGEFLILSSRDTPEGGNGLFSLSVATGELRRLTKPPPEAWSGDLSPAVSPDGRTLAFTRSLTRANSEIYLLPLDDKSAARGEPQRLTFENRASAQPAWTPDGRSIVFASGSRGSASSSSLLMIPASASGEKAARIPVGEGGESPAISSQGRLVYMRWVRDENVWRLNLPGGTAERFVFSTRRDVEPRFSADGKRIAFTSDRTGTNEVWVCDADGTNPMQLTSFAANSTAGGRWSPDGRRIVFVSNVEGQMEIYLTSSDGGKPQRLTDNPAHDSAPSWSRDGKWIYFASNREDEFQVWKMQPDPKAAPVRVTRNGGYAAIESADGRTLYYARRDDRSTWAVWKMPAEGGPEVKVIPEISTWGDFDVSDLGIYYVDSPLAGAKLRLYRFSDGSSTVLGTLQKRVSFGVSASPDDRVVLYTQFDQESTELMLVENFVR